MHVLYDKCVFHMAQVWSCPKYGGFKLASSWPTRRIRSGHAAWASAAGARRPVLAAWLDCGCAMHGTFRVASARERRWHCDRHSYPTISLQALLPHAPISGTLNTRPYLRHSYHTPRPSSSHHLIPHQSTSETFSSTFSSSSYHLRTVVFKGCFFNLR